MSNLFLPPFPEVGFTQDYIDAINAIFQAIANHTHIPIINNDGIPTYPEGNQIESDSVSWTGILTANSLQNCNSVSLAPNTGSPPDSTVFISGPYNDLYFKKIGVTDPIQITNLSFLDSIEVINGIKGDFTGYGASLNFSTSTNTYNFTYPGSNFLSIYSNVNTVTSLSSTLINSTTLNLTNAPNLSSSGYTHYNPYGAFEYFISPIKLDHTTQATSYVFDNLTTYLVPPLGFGTTYPAITSVTNSITLAKYSTYSGAPPTQTIIYNIQDAVWFPIIANDELANGLIKSAFYCEPFSPLTRNAFPLPESYTVYPTLDRWVWALNASNSPNNYTNYSRIMHYNFTLLNSPTSPNQIIKWNDCLLENTTNGGAYIEKYILMDIQGPDFGPTSLTMKFNYIYDMGILEV